MSYLSDPRPPLPEWVLNVYNVLCAHSHNADTQEDVQLIVREQALKILRNADELALEPEDVNYALSRLLERGYFYEVDGELRVTMPEE